MTTEKLTVGYDTSEYTTTTSTHIEKTLKEFDERKHNWRKDFDFWEADMKDVITQALQEQDRESRNKVLRELWKMGTVYETMDTRSATIAYAKQHNIDLHEN